MGGSPSRDRCAEAITLFENALALDPRSVEAQSGLATDLASRVIDNMTDTAAADLVRAEALALVPKVRALLAATYFAGLGKAGMPEE
jgi:hypothetical protein